MELIIVIFFFALTSAISLKVFVKAHLFDTASKDTINAVFWADNTSELFYEFGTDTAKIAKTISNNDNLIISSTDSISFYLDKNYDIVEPHSNSVIYKVDLVFNAKDSLIYMNYYYGKVTDNSVIYEFEYRKHIQEVVDGRKKEN